MLSRHLRPAVDYFEMQTGQRIGALFCAHLPERLGWLEETLAAAVDLEYFSPDFAKWLPAVGIDAPGPRDARALVDPAAFAGRAARARPPFPPRHEQPRRHDSS